MASVGTPYAELELKKKLLLEELQATQNQILSQNEIQGAMDIHHPERSPGWKPYRHQEYPKMLYHPVKLDQMIEDRRLGIRRRNEANPNLAPLDIPAQEPHRIIVKSAAEEEKYVNAGYVTDPRPIFAKLRGEEPEQRDPLAESVGLSGTADAKKRR